MYLKTRMSTSKGSQRAKAKPQNNTPTTTTTTTRFIVVIIELPSQKDKSYTQKTSPMSTPLSTYNPEKKRRAALSMDDDNTATTEAVNNAVAAVTPASIVDLTQDNEDASSDDDEEAEEEATQHQRVASCEATIVGIRYYNGTVHPGEFVSLVREPNNSYDSNAIRVDNMQGEKVGHIKATQAKIMAPFLDEADNLGTIVVNAVIPRGGNAYTIPCGVEFLACGTAAELPQRALELAQQLKKVFKSKLSFRSHIKLPNSKAKKATTAPMVETQAMEWTKQAQQLDEMFDQQVAKQLQNLPLVEVPSMLCTNLLDYQQDGLKWLVHQDTVDHLPFFKQIQENGKRVWHCEISNASQATAPKPFRGGILADEMGL